MFCSARKPNTARRAPGAKAPRLRSSAPSTGLEDTTRSPKARFWGIWLVALVLLVTLVGCGPAWQAAVVAPDGSDYLVDGTVLESLADLSDQERGLPLERLLLAAGHRAVEQVEVIDDDGVGQAFDWPAVAGDAWWREDGRVAIGHDLFRASRIKVTPPLLLEQVQADITDVATTAAAALGLPAPGRATGQALDVPAADHVLLLFLDGLGYVRYTEALNAGLVPNLATLGQPLVGLTVYPPCTSVATAALLTGAPPEVSGVDRRGMRKTESETLFDVAAQEGLHVVAVEGDALAFALRNAEFQLSGDRDGDGSTDDNVLANALAVLDGGMPDLFYVHFHGIDDAGHKYGPSAMEEAAAIRRVDAAVGQIFEALPDGTLVIIFADHGMHPVEEGGRLGNHGYLIERDMFIPIFVVSK